MSVIAVEVIPRRASASVEDGGKITVVYGAVEGPGGHPGPGSPFLVLTQAAYDALPVKDPQTLYVVT